MEPHPHQLDFNTLAQLAGGRCGTFDVPCPACSHLRKRSNQRKPVFRIWSAPGFLTFYCTHCGIKGHSRDPQTARPDHLTLERVRAEARQRARAEDEVAVRAARGLWWRSDLITKGSVAWTYLRHTRGYQKDIPSTLRYLPATGEYPPALIAAFGIPSEPEPDVVDLPIDQVRAVQLVRLTPDGRKIDGLAKITCGRPRGVPMVLSPINDGLGLWIAEGPENALSALSLHKVGMWAAGGASFLPALAEVVPSWTDCVRVLADRGDDGERFAHDLVRKLTARGIFGEAVYPDTADEVRAVS